MMLVSARSNALGDAARTWCGIAAMQSAALGWSLPDGGTMTLGLVHVSMPSRRSTCVGEFALPEAGTGRAAKPKRTSAGTVRPRPVFSRGQRRGTTEEWQRAASPSNRAPPGHDLFSARSQ